MDIEKIVTLAATVVSFAISGIGLPLQIYKTRQMKTAGSLSPLTFILTFTAYFLWSARAFIIQDWYMLIAYSPGILFSAIILWQIYFYRKNLQKHMP